MSVSEKTRPVRFPEECDPMVWIERGEQEIRPRRAEKRYSWGLNNQFIDRDNLFPSCLEPLLTSTRNFAAPIFQRGVDCSFKGIARFETESVFQNSVDSAKVHHFAISSSTKAFFSGIRLSASLPRGNRNGDSDSMYPFLQKLFAERTNTPPSRS
jgi:hypothetical protein